MRSDKRITVLDEKGGTDWIKSFFDAGFIAEPDTKFNYISENTFMLSAIISKVTGMSMIDYLNERMFILADLYSGKKSATLSSREIRPSLTAKPTAVDVTDLLIEYITCGCSGAYGFQKHWA